MDFTPQVETAEIADAELDAIAGGLGVSGTVNQVVGTVDGLTGGTVSSTLGQVNGTVQQTAGINAVGTVEGLTQGL
ncbi:type A2 lantipeptide [Streptomyces sp. NPDC053542]|uniref:type A2 lantipeptide n=1 Tax=Streptomyces sp. NPDC053542 TaxID=3365710 RepID=UPI0037D62028